MSVCCLDEAYWWCFQPFAADPSPSRDAVKLSTAYMFVGVGYPWISSFPAMWAMTKTWLFRVCWGLYYPVIYRDYNEPRVRSFLDMKLFYIFADWSSVDFDRFTISPVKFAAPEKLKDGITGEVVEEAWKGTNQKHMYCNDAMKIDL